MSFGKFKDLREGGEGKLIPESGDNRPSLSQGDGSAKGSTLIDRGCKIVGKLILHGPAQLEGEVEGDITAHDALTIGEGAIINAKVSGTDIVVRGTVKGDIVASKRLSLRKPARVVGNISSTSLTIEEGVTFQGGCAMASAEQPTATAPQSGAAERVK